MKVPQNQSYTKLITKLFEFTVNLGTVQK